MRNDLDDALVVCATLDLLFAETERVRSGQRLLADRLFDELLVQLLRWLPDCPQQTAMAPGVLHRLSDPCFARTQAAVHEDPGALGYANASSLSRVFTQETGLSPRAWLQAQD